MWDSLLRARKERKRRIEARKRKMKGGSEGVF